MEVRLGQPLLDVVGRPPNVAGHAAGHPLTVVVDLNLRPLALVAGSGFDGHCGTLLGVGFAGALFVVR